MSAISPVKIRLEHVSHSFPASNGTLSVLEDISIDIYEGEVVSLVGPSGCGKTTLLNLVAGFLSPTSGAVYVDGRIVSGPGPDRGVIFQQYAVFPWLTVRENILFGLTLRANRALREQAELVLSHYVDLMGLRGFETAYPKTLSGGMKQRVAIARAYAVSPAILLMDEPFGALDAQTRDTMQEMLLTLLSQERKTVLFITHSVEEAVFVSRRIVVLTKRPGRVLDVVPVPLDYPRETSVRTSREFTTIRHHVEQLIRGQYHKSTGR